MILEKLMKSAAEHAAARQQARSFKEIEKCLSETADPQGFVATLSTALGVGLIAELKPASPSAGIIRQPFPVAELAGELVAGGADCLSVLTEEEHFLGALDNLARAAVGVPRLQKDFLLSEYQVLEGRAAGADAVLLIAEALTATRARQLCQLALSLGMDVLYEAHDPAHVRQVVALAETQPDRILVGINNRNLQTFHVDLQTTLRALQSIPQGLYVVAESGIHSADDVMRLHEAGACGLLVGESIMCQQDVAQAVRTLLSKVRMA